MSWLGKSLPMRGAWIEMAHPWANCCVLCRSLPMRGAWIEIHQQRQQRRSSRSRSPCGERGLKFEGRISRAHDFGRSPCGERGLKLDLDPDLKTEKSSLPMRGAWIEIFTIARSASAFGRSPCGERGLKS